MNIEPKIYIATDLELHSWFTEEHLKWRTSRTYQLTCLSFESEKQSFIDTSNFIASLVFKGELSSLLQYSDNSIMVCGYYKAIIVDTNKMT